MGGDDKMALAIHHSLNLITVGLVKLCHAE